MHDPVFPNGCAVCEVEVDPETGWVDITRYTVVDDVGRCINPLIVHGQTHGGIAQGVGQAMWEECALDPASGQPLVRVVHGLRHAALGQSAVVHDRDRRGAVADQPVRHQGRRRRRLHAGARGRRQRDPRRARPARRARHHDAVHAAQGVAGDPRGESRVGRASDPSRVRRIGWRRFSRRAGCPAKSRYRGRIGSCQRQIRARSTAS